MDDLAIGIRQQPGPRIVRADRPRQGAQPLNGRLHVHGVEGARDAELDQTGSLRRLGGERCQLLLRTGGDDLAGSVVVGGRQPLGIDRGQHLIAVPADHSGHRGRLRRARLGHQPAPFADQHHGLFGRQYADAGGRGDLTDGVPGRDSDEGERVRWMGEKLECGQQARGNEQRLGDRRIADRLRVGQGSVVGQVDARHGRQPGQPRGERGFGQPRGHEAGGLGALTRRDNREHVPTLSRNHRPARAETRRIS